MKVKNTSIAAKFAIILIGFVFVAALISAIGAWVTQQRLYHSQFQTILNEVNQSFSTTIGRDIDEFAALQDYFKEHKEELKIPLHYPDNADQQYLDFAEAFRENYPDQIYGVDVTFDELDEETRLLYARYKYLFYLNHFDDMVKDYNLEYAYYVYPIEQEDYVCYMFDGAREEVIIDGESCLNLGFEAYEDRTLHKNMWIALETGQVPDEMDVYDNEFGNVYTAAVPIRYNDETLGVLLTDISVGYVNDRIRSSTLLLVLSSVISLGILSFFICLYVKKSILDRILQLKTGIESYAENKNPELAKTIRSDVKSQDELGVLALGFADMIDELHNYMDNLQHVTAEKERIGAELNIATDIQASMLPRIFPTFPDRREYELFASMDPAKEVGGDFYDFFMIDENHLAIVMADVSGKGVPAALFMAIAKVLIKESAQGTQDPSRILANANLQLCENNDAELFVTVWLGIVDIRNGSLDFADAGHEYPVLLHPDGTYMVIKPEKKKPPVATLEGIKYITNHLQLSLGDTLFLYTDGVPEATNAHDELYGMERLEAVMKDSAGLSPKELLPKIRADVDAFVGDAVQFDDLTMLALKLREWKKDAGEEA